MTATPGIVYAIWSEKSSFSLVAIRMGSGREPRGDPCLLLPASPCYLKAFISVGLRSLHIQCGIHQRECKSDDDCSQRK